MPNNKLYVTNAGKLNLRTKQLFRRLILGFLNPKILIQKCACNNLAQEVELVV
jgi:hypothetical protein